MLVFDRELQKGYFMLDKKNKAEMTLEVIETEDSTPVTPKTKKQIREEKKAAKKKIKQDLIDANYGWKNHKKGLFDRYDGRKLKTVAAMSKFMPYIMAKRSDACNTYADSFEVTKTDEFIQQKRAEGKENFGILHVLIAAYVRAVSQRPGVNRYVSGQKIFARTQLAVVMTIKRKMSADSPDTCIKVKFYPTDTVDDVYDKFNAAVSANAVEGEENSFDVLNKVLCYIPGLLLRFTCQLLFFLDYFGWIPKSIVELSPFHGSMIITSMGSLGIKPIYHHIYDFGNLPLFLCYGVKRTVMEHNRKGELVKKKYVDFKAVTDERIVDGYYYASAFKLIKHYVENPALLNEPPKEVFDDID